MHLELRLYSGLQKYNRAFNNQGKAPLVQVAEGTTAGELIARLRIPASAVGLIVINHKIATADTVLNPGDRVSLSSPISGG